MCIGFFLISYVLHKRIMASGNYLLKGEKLLSEEMEIVFTELLLVGRDEMSDEKHEEIHTLSFSLIEKNQTVFEPLLLSTNSVRVQSLNCVTM